MAERKQVLIVGGGFTGLTAAWKLSQDPAFALTVVEAGEDLGGLAGGFPLLGTSLEKTYHHLFLTDSCFLRLVEELGLGDKLMWCESSVGIYRGGQCYPFMSAWDLLRFTPCGLLGRLRLGVTALYLKHRANWRGLAPRPAHEWMSRACGRDAMASVWTPLLKGKFDRYYGAVSMAWLWARIHSRANSRRGGGKERLGYFKGGFASVVNRLRQELERREVCIQMRSRVERLAGDQRRAQVNGAWTPFDFCIFTGPSPALAKLLPPGPAMDPYARQLGAIEYLGAICLVFVSGQDLSDYYWLNVNETDAPFLVFLNHTKLVDRSYYRSRYVYYIGAYLPVEHPLFSLSDDTLADKWWSYLGRMFPEFDRAQVSERHVFRFHAAQHIVDTRYEEKIPDYRTPLPGVFLANFSQIFPQDRGTNWAVSEGLKIADLVSREPSPAC